MGGFIDVGIGLIDDYREGASASKALSNAGVNFAFGFAEGVFIATASALFGPFGFVGATIVVVAYEAKINPRAAYYDDANSLE